MQYPPVTPPPSRPGVGFLLPSEVGTVVCEWMGTPPVECGMLTVMVQLTVIMDPVVVVKLPKNGGVVVVETPSARLVLDSTGTVVMIVLTPLTLLVKVV